MKLNYVLLIFILMNLASCKQIALFNTPEKKAQISTSKSAHYAKQYFWKTLHQGKYKDISKVDYLLMAEYLKNPNDPILASMLGFVHIWKITERARIKDQSPLLPNEIILSKKYFSDALQLDPYNPIYQGFYGDTQLIEGQIFHDNREQVAGFFSLKEAIRNWPEFNYFTAGYPMSSLAFDSKNFKQGLEWQWKTLDICAGTKINRQHPDFSSFMNRETTTGSQRVCWNSAKAPHNFEGFFMNMGDMLIKSGDVAAAVQIYKNARLSKSYSQWSYKTMLEKRIINASANVSNFRKNRNDPDQVIMFNSGYGCVSCHQN